MMRRRIPTPIVWLAIAVTMLSLPGAVMAAAGGGHGSEVAQVHAGTARFHQLADALAAGYGPLHVCTDEETGLGAMGQHYANGALVSDAVFDLTRPEVLVYEPTKNGRMRLVAVEFVVFLDVWGSGPPPELFGRELQLVPAPNRYGVPSFYQIHVWLWKHNPAGMFSDWNTRVSCLGMGDEA